MALIKFGAFMTDLSGKVGGTIFSKNRGGNYAKNLVIPNNPATAAQSRIRGIFSTLSSQWKSLTEQQRNSWSESAINFPRINRVGDQIILAGNALFVSLNAALMVIGEAINLSAPTPKGTLTPIITSFLPESTETVTDMLVYFQAFNTEDFHVQRVSIFATPPLSPGVSNPSGKFKLLTSPEATLSNQVEDIGEKYVALFGLPKGGSKVFIKLVATNIYTGEQSAEVTKGAIVKVSI